MPRMKVLSIADALCHIFKRKEFDDISTMMGHTIISSSATTLNYLSRYNMVTMVTNNSKLLSTKDKSQKKAELVERLKEMDQEKLEAMLKLIG